MKNGNSRSSVSCSFFKKLHLWLKIGSLVFALLGIGATIIVWCTRLEGKTLNQQALLSSIKEEGCLKARENEKAIIALRKDVGHIKTTSDNIWEKLTEEDGK